MIENKVTNLTPAINAEAGSSQPAGQLSTKKNSHPSAQPDKL